MTNRSAENQNLQPKLTPVDAYISALGITWPLATISGYGVYGIEIAQSFFRQGGKRLLLTKRPAPLALPPLLQLRLAPALQLAEKFDAALAADPEHCETFDFPVLHGVGNDCAGFVGSDQVRGQPNVGCAAIEHLYSSPHGRTIAKVYERFIAISRWNAEYIRSLNLAPVHLCHQGIDTDLFFPQAKRGLYPNRFLIFSGGKFEYRKGQDIVVAAFKQFATKHPEAMLICAWQSQTVSDPAPFAVSGHIAATPQSDGHGALDLMAWLQQQGLTPQQFIALPFTHQMVMPTVLRECDAALFPNRCEGGTNLVAMEAMACGIPCLVAANTGQRDLVDLLGAMPLSQQSACAPSLDPRTTTADWGESSVDECVAGLEKIYQDYQAARDAATATAAKVAAWNWTAQNERLLAALR